MARGGKKSRQVSMAALVAALSLTSAQQTTADIVFMGDEVIRTAPVAVVSTQDVTLVVPVRERGPLGQATTIISPNSAVRVKAEDLVGLLSRIVTPAAVADLRAAVDSEGFLSPQALEPLGYTLKFDPAMLDLALTLPLEARQRRTLGLGFDASSEAPEVTNLPAGFSAYLNYRASLDYFHQATGSRDEGLAAPRFDLDFNGNVGRFAFENQLTIDDEAETTFQRNASRVIFDQPNSALRWVAGDLIPEGTSFQSASDIAGLSVSRLYNLRPDDRFVTSRSSRTVTLREESTVDVIVNGAIARTLLLPPGTYDLRDLPLTQGGNAVQIVIEGPSGQREIVDFDFFSDSTLLAPGVDEFFVGAGIEAPRENGGIDYQTDDPIVSGFYRRGLTEQLTAGGNIQANKDAVLAGAEFVFGGKWGLSSFDLAGSNNDENGSGFAARGEHRMSRDQINLPGRESFDVSVEYRSPDFAPIESLGPALNYSVQIAARYSRALTRSITASIGGDYAAGRAALSDRYGASLFTNWRVSADTNVNFGATYTNAGFSGEETNLFVNLTRRFGSTSTFTAAAETRNGLVRAGYARAPLQALDAWAYSVDVSRTDDAVGLNGTAVYIANRGEFELNHATIFDTDGDISDQVTSARVNGAIGFAGGRFGIGGRVYDSFALVDGHSSLGDRPVLIRGVDALDATARSGAFGPALVPLGSYYVQSVPYDVEDLPIGYDLGTGIFELLPRFHNGYALTVGSDYFVTATGILLDGSGTPLSLRSGLATSLDDPDAPTPEVITNRVGRFAVSGLAAGRWRLTFQGSPPLSYDIVVPNETLFRTGSLNPSGSGE